MIVSHLGIKSFGSKFGLSLQSMDLKLKRIVISHLGI
jgi:hypothetical protein